MKYTSVDEAACIIAKLGRGSLLAKIDIAHAYRNVPVHPDDRHLLGMLWDESLYVDTVLPFGLRSAPKIFSAISDSLEWILRQHGIQYVVHYLDDFLTIGAPNANECQQNLKVLVSTCEKLGLPLAIEKIEGPVSALTFLGIRIDSSRMTMSLPEAKIVELKQLVSHWLHKKAVTKRELLSLIGHLSFASKVVPSGRTFTLRMIDLSTTRSCLDHYIRLNTEFHSDLVWWHLFLDKCTHTSRASDICM